MHNLAVIGLGRWGKNLIGEFSKISNILICCSLGNLENKKWLELNYPKVKFTNKIEEIVNNRFVESVVIATPIDTHYNIAKMMLSAHKNVFLEKPMATKLAQAQDLQNKSLHFKKKLLIGHVYLYHEVFSEIEKLILTKKILEILFEWNKFGSFSEDIKWNLLSHDIALAIKLIGIPNNIKVISEKSIKSSSDIGSWELNYASGTKCRIYINRVSEFKSKKITIFLEDQKIIWENEILYSDGNGSLKIIYKPRRNALSHECEDFINCIQSNQTPLSDGKLGLEVVEQICSIL